MSRKLSLLLIATLTLTCALATNADTVTASGAGSTPASAQDLTSANPTEIDGTLAEPSDVAVFKIDVTDYQNFWAETENTGAFGITDTVLALFDSNGLGIYLNDDVTFANTLSCLPSMGVSNPCPSGPPAGVGPTANGIYYLAISVSSNYPVSVDGEIFSPVLSTDVVGPDPTQGGGSPVIGWDNGYFTNPDSDDVNYKILLNGASSSGSVPTPESSTLVLLGIGLTLISAYRKSRWKTSALLSVTRS
jgi:hypothetical protein